MSTEDLPVASPGESAQITRLLKAWGRGDSAALDRLTPLVYDHLHRIARKYVRRERPGYTLQATALVNEAFLRLVDTRDLEWADRAHFFAVCARVMRRILVDAARSRVAIKRGGQGGRAEHASAINLDRLPSPGPVSSTVSPPKKRSSMT
jgi:RNA polymerase sigma factor (TIGR02999 family)